MWVMSRYLDGERLRESERAKAEKAAQRYIDRAN